MIFDKTLQLLISSLSKKSTITFLLMKRASLTQSQDSHLNFEEKPCFDFHLITFSNISLTNYLIIYLFYILYKQSFYSFIFPLLISILKCLTFLSILIRFLLINYFLFFFFTTYNPYIIDSQIYFAQVTTQKKLIFCSTHNPPAFIKPIDPKPINHYHLSLSRSD